MLEVSLGWEFLGSVAMLELSCLGKYREADIFSFGGGQCFWLFLYTRWPEKGKSMLQTHLYNLLQENKRKIIPIIILCDVTAGRDRDKRAAIVIHLH